MNDEDKSVIKKRALLVRLNTVGRTINKNIAVCLYIKKCTP